MFRVAELAVLTFFGVLLGVGGFVFALGWVLGLPTGLAALALVARHELR